MKNKTLIGFIALCQIKTQKSLLLCKKSTHVCCAVDIFSLASLLFLLIVWIPANDLLLPNWAVNWRFASVLWKLIEREEEKKTECLPKENHHQGQNISCHHQWWVWIPLRPPVLFRNDPEKPRSQSRRKHLAPGMNLKLKGTNECWMKESLALEGPWAIPRACCYRNSLQKYNRISNLF